MPILPTTHPLAAAFVDLDGMAVMLNSGVTVPIVNLLDADGDDCGPEDAVVAIAGNGRGWWRVPIFFVPREELN